jgi:hypothetical protein
MNNMRLLKIISVLIVVSCQAYNASAAPLEQKVDDAHCKALLAKQMPIDKFWSLVEKTIDKDDYEQQLALEAALRPLSADEVLGFDITFRAQHIRSRTWDLWGVAYIANGGASDDGFEYFRYWLMSRGRKVFEQVLAAPDSLADVVPADRTSVLENEPFAAASMRVWMHKTGKSFEDYYVYVADCQSYPEQPSGTKPKSLEKSFPKTWKRFGNNPLG